MRRRAPPRWDHGAETLPTFGVSATEIDAEGDDPLHWLLLTTERPAEGEADAVHAATVLDWYRRRWTIETWFRTLKTGTRIKDRRLDSADDLRKCLAFDAVTAVHVADLTVLARERPETPAAEAFPDADVDLLHTLLESQGHRNVVRMPDGKAPDIRAVVIDLGRLVGSHPSARQPLPGTKKVWQGLERLHWAVQVRGAIGERKREYDHFCKCGTLKDPLPRADSFYDGFFWAFWSQSATMRISDEIAKSVRSRVQRRVPGTSRHDAISEASTSLNAQPPHPM